MQNGFRSLLKRRDQLPFHLCDWMCEETHPLDAVKAAFLSSLLTRGYFDMKSGTRRNMAGWEEMEAEACKELWSRID